jgi:protein-S-isoprenylcysteine O-methyltransferase Ste14
MEKLLSLYLPLYMLFYFSIVFVFPSYRIWKQTGINPITFGKEDTAHNYIGIVMKILIFLMFLSVFIFSFGKKFYSFLVPIAYLSNQIFLIIGLVLIHISFFLIIIAQFQMGKSWRIGIDEKNKTPLICTGIFRISRNPIFLGMMISILGIFLIIPNALTFFLMANTYFVIQIQIRLEEEFLEKQHQEIYRIYKSKVRRLL